MTILKDRWEYTNQQFISISEVSIIIMPIVYQVFYLSSATSESIIDSILESNEKDNAKNRRIHQSNIYQFFQSLFHNNAYCLSTSFIWHP